MHTRPLSLLSLTLLSLGLVACADDQVVVIVETGGTMGTETGSSAGTETSSSAGTETGDTTGTETGDTTGTETGDPAGGVCGDGVVDEGEACDDGNEVDTDACTNACTEAICGDGIVHEGVEPCDDGNASNNDDCLDTCKPASCGDGLVHESVEACDDGNDDNTDACIDTCALASCGDGFVWEGVEACDDGNDDDDDGCTTTCLPSSCVDGVLNGDESDVDCGGSCDGCELGLACIEADDCASNTCEDEICKLGQRIEASLYHTCALTESGAVRCWGRGFSGQLGYGNTNNVGDDETPASVGDVDVGGVVVGLSMGNTHTCALLEGGTVRCWGSGVNGQLGYANTDDIGDNELPVSAGDVDVGGVVTQLESGYDHVCALLVGGAVRCWGRGDDGQLGYANTNNIGDDEHPASAGDVDVGGAVMQLALGSRFTCALLETGAVRCWGEADNGKLGYPNTGTIGDDEHPSSAGDVDLGGLAVELTAGGGVTCALLESGSVRCWGWGHLGRLGYADTDDVGDNETPASVGDVDIGGPVAHIAAGGSHVCALLESGSIRCWGNGDFGRLGYGNTADIGDNEHPSSAGDVDFGDGTVAQLVAGVHTCVLLQGGAIRCWGQADDGQLGYGNTNNIGDDELPASAGDVDWL